MTGKRTDIHRRAVIDPADYEYESVEGAADKLRVSSAAGLRAYGEDEINRCDHCGARLKRVTVRRHLPTGGHIAAGTTCAKETLRVPDRMTLDIKRLADWRAGVERPRTREEWREYRLKEARHTYPETLATLRAILDGGMGGEGYEWWRSATGNDRGFLRELAERFEESGRVSEGVDRVVRRIRVAAIDRGRRLAAGMQRAPIGRGLTIEGVVLSTAWRSNGYEFRPALLVEGDEGWRVEVTKPKHLEVAEGECVRFIADVEHSRRDPYLGWGKRPRQAEVLGEEVTEAKADGQAAGAESPAWAAQSEKFSASSRRRNSGAPRA